MELTKEILDQLKTPFPVQHVHWKPQATNRDKTQGLAVAYLDARDVMKRLDDVVAGEWEFRWESDGVDVVGRLTVCGVTRMDVGESGSGPQGNTRKAAVSDALKRSAVMFGVGRYLYAVPAVWCDGAERGRAFVFTKTPTLPRWATPEGYAAMRKEQEPDPVPQEHDESAPATEPQATTKQATSTDAQKKSSNNGNKVQAPPWNNAFWAWFGQFCDNQSVEAKREAYEWLKANGKMREHLGLYEKLEDAQRDAIHGMHDYIKLAKASETESAPEGAMM